MPTFEVNDIVRALHGVRDQWRDAAIEQAIQQAPAFRLHPVLALELRTVEKPSTVLLRTDRALVEQAIEQGLDGGFLPVLPAGQRADVNPIRVS